jgi:hypothetical protein
MFVMLLCERWLHSICLMNMRDIIAGARRGYLAQECQNLPLSFVYHQEMNNGDPGSHS